MQKPQDICCFQMTFLYSRVSGLSCRWRWPHQNISALTFIFPIAISYMLAQNVSCYLFDFHLNSHSVSFGILTGIYILPSTHSAHLVAVDRSWQKFVLALNRVIASSECQQQTIRYQVTHFYSIIFQSTYQPESKFDNIWLIGKEEKLNRGAQEPNAISSSTYTWNTSCYCNTLALHSKYIWPLVTKTCLNSSELNS